MGVGKILKNEKDFHILLIGAGMFLPRMAAGIPFAC